MNTATIKMIIQLTLYSSPLLVAGWLIKDSITFPSEIRLGLWEAIRRILQPEPLSLQWAFVKVLAKHFGREILAILLICYSLSLLFMTLICGS